MLTGYSVVLYFIPTIFCIIPSLYWHLIMLGVEGLLRAIFLLRNYSSKLDSKAYIMFVVILMIEGLYVYILLQTMFQNNSGYSIDEGTKQVFGHNLALRNYNDVWSYLSNLSITSWIHLNIFFSILLTKSIDFFKLEQVDWFPIFRFSWKFSLFLFSGYLSFILMVLAL